VESLGVVALLDFLTGCSLDEVTRCYRLSSTLDTEAAIRAVLLRHGYGADVPRAS
jgi:hypothetical protein